ncbi:MAG: RDD family protein, partial [Candidatus Dormibacteraeota bacterium]|nr:RDD family protein [Candidatus Dormibacteraeota bacterium]
MQAAMAGFWRRLVALIIDSIVVGVVAGLVSVAIEALLHVTTTNGSSGIRGTVQFILGLIYFGWLWSTRGQTLGYMAMGMRLARVDGTQIGVGRALLRYILIELSFG